jgi:hypothetical protein
MINHCSRGVEKRLWYRYCVKRAMLTQIRGLCSVYAYHYNSNQYL